MNNKKENKKVASLFLEDFKSFYENILIKKRYYIFLLFFALVAYGYNMVSETISMDDMTFYIFGKGDHYAVKIMRWGIYLLYPFISTKEYSPFVNSLFAILLLVVAAILLSFLFYCLNGKKNNIYLYTVLSNLFVTYPLINEIWNCSAMSVNIFYNGISFYMCLSLISVIYLYYVDGYGIRSLIISGTIMAPVMAGYESVVGFYVTLVLIVVYFKNFNKLYTNSIDWIIDGFRYALPLIVAFVLRQVVGYALIAFYQVEPASSLARTNWGVKSLKDIFVSLLYNGWYYIIRGLSYFPIGEFVLALIAYVIITIRDGKESKRNLLIGLCIVLSCYLLSIIQGNYLYYRLAQSIQLFIAYTGYLVIDRSSLHIKPFSIVLLLLLCLRQSVCLHDYLALNHQRSENEAFIARQIGYEIYSKYDKDKLVIFCGEYQLGDFIQEQIVVDENSLGGKLEKYLREKMGVEQTRAYEEYVFNNINSYFNKQMDAFNGQELLQRYLSYYGFDINVLKDLSDEQEDKLKGYYENIAQDVGMKPYEIKDMGDYLLVYLGPTIDNEYKLKY